MKTAKEQEDNYRLAKKVSQCSKKEKVNRVRFFSKLYEDLNLYYNTYKKLYSKYNLCELQILEYVHDLQYLTVSQTVSSQKRFIPLNITILVLKIPWQGNSNIIRHNWERYYFQSVNLKEDIEEESCDSKKRWKNLKNKNQVTFPRYSLILHRRSWCWKKG